MRTWYNDRSRRGSGKITTQDICWPIRAGIGAVELLNVSNHYFNGLDVVVVWLGCSFFVVTTTEAGDR